MSEQHRRSHQHVCFLS